MSRATCQLLGHSWSEWKWSCGWSERWTPGKGSQGPGHDEERKCERCDKREFRYDLPGKYEGMTEAQRRGLERSIAEGLVKGW